MRSVKFLLGGNTEFYLLDEFIQNLATVDQTVVLLVRVGTEVLFEKDMTLDSGQKIEISAFDNKGFVRLNLVD